MTNQDIRTLSLDQSNGSQIYFGEITDQWSGGDKQSNNDPAPTENLTNYFVGLAAVFEPVLLVPVLLSSTYNHPSYHLHGDKNFNSTRKEIINEAVEKSRWFHERVPTLFLSPKFSYTTEQCLIDWSKKPDRHPDEKLRYVYNLYASMTGKEQRPTYKVEPGHEGGIVDGIKQPQVQCRATLPVKYGWHLPY